MKNRFLSLFIASVMVLGLLAFPSTAVATGTTVVLDISMGDIGGNTLGDGILPITNPNGTYRIIQRISGPTGNTITVPPGFQGTIILDGVNIHNTVASVTGNNPTAHRAPITLGNVAHANPNSINMTLIVRGENRLEAGVEGAGINDRFPALLVPRDSTIVIRGYNNETEGNVLRAYSRNAAAIGGEGGNAQTRASGHITIDSGTIHAQVLAGGGAAIGGSPLTGGRGLVTINGGNITAIAASNGAGAGIGGGAGGNAGAQVEINGGIVYARGGQRSPGIGNGQGVITPAQYAEFPTWIRITGGNVTARSPHTGFHAGAPGIGGTIGNTVGLIEITGGTIHAAGSGTQGTTINDNGTGAGIGASGFVSVGNHDVTRGRIIISGGDITAIGAGASPGIGGGVHENGTTVMYPFESITVLPRANLNGATIGGADDIFFSDSSSNPSAEYRSSVSQFGITWYFSEPMMTGQFAAGDWWVVGPVEIIGITPQTVEIQQAIPFATSWSGNVPNLSYANHTVSMHGSMLNAYPRAFATGPNFDATQGFDTRLARMRGGYATTGQILPGDFETTETVYRAELNVARNLPLTLQPGDSLISSESFETPASAPTNRAFNPHNNTQIKTMAILTVLDTPAPSGAFRPPYIRPEGFGTDGFVVTGNEMFDLERLTSVTWTVDDLDFLRLARVALPEGMNFASPRMQTSCWFTSNNQPISRCITQTCYGCSGYGNNPQDWMAWITRLVERPRIHIQTTWLGRNWHPYYNFLPLCGGAIANNGAYGREMANVIGAALLTLQLDIYTDEEKQELLIHLVQYGIDIYGIVSSGGAWHNDGGHNMGRKMPMLLAGAVLNDDRIMGFGDAEQHFVFHEDQQTFFVSQSDISDVAMVPFRNAQNIITHHVPQPRIWDNDHPETHAVPRAPTRPELVPFTQDMLGRPAWGQQPHDPLFDRGRFRSGANWSAAYREINSSVMMPHVLTARLMGLEEYWNWPALFEYMDLVALHDRVAHFPLPTSPTNEPNFHTGVISMLPFTARMWNAYRWESGVEPIAVPPCDCAHDLVRANFLNPICIEHPVLR